MGYSIDIKGLDKLMPKIKSLPDKAKEEVLTAVADYSVNDVLKKEYPPQKSVSRKSVYGTTFKSPAQQAWFWANIDPEVDLPYKRTQHLAESWSAQVSTNEVRFRNEAEYAKYVMGDKQSKHEKAVGWKKAADIVSTKLSFRSSTFRKTVEDAVRKAIGKLQLG